MIKGQKNLTCREGKRTEVSPGFQPGEKKTPGISHQFVSASLAGSNGDRA